jgi:hypothetical protein
MRVSVQPNRPDHRHLGSIGLGDNGIVGNIDPFVIDPNAIMAVMRFPVDIRNRHTIRVRTAAALFAGQLLKLVVQRRIGISAVAVVAMRQLDGQQDDRKDGA